MPGIQRVDSTQFAIGGSGQKKNQSHKHITKPEMQSFDKDQVRRYAEAYDIETHLHIRGEDIPLATNVLIEKIFKNRTWVPRITRTRSPRVAVMENNMYEEISGVPAKKKKQAATGRRSAEVKPAITEHARSASGSALRTRKASPVPTEHGNGNEHGHSSRGQISQQSPMGQLPPRPSDPVANMYLQDTPGVGEPGPSTLAHRRQSQVAGDSASFGMIPTEPLNASRRLERLATQRENTERSDNAATLAAQRQKLKRLFAAAQDEVRSPKPKRNWEDTIALSGNKSEDEFEPPPDRSRRLRLGQTFQDVANGDPLPMQFTYPPQAPLDPKDPHWLKKMFSEVTDERKELIRKYHEAYRKVQMVTAEAQLLETELRAEVFLLEQMLTMLRDVAGDYVVDTVIAEVNRRLGRGEDDSDEDDAEEDRAGAEDVPMSGPRKQLRSILKRTHQREDRAEEPPSKRRRAAEMTQPMGPVYEAPMAEVAIPQGSPPAIPALSFAQMSTSSPPEDGANQSQLVPANGDQSDDEHSENPFEERTSQALQTDVFQQHEEEEREDPFTDDVTPESQIIPVDYSDNQIQLQTSLRRNGQLPLSSPATRSPPRLRRRSSVAPQTPADRIVSLGWRPPSSDDSSEPIPETAAKAPTNRIPALTEMFARRSQASTSSRPHFSPYQATHRRSSIIPSKLRVRSDASDDESSENPFQENASRRTSQAQAQGDVFGGQEDEQCDADLTDEVTPESQIIPVDYSDNQIEIQASLRRSGQLPVSSPVVHSPPPLRRRSSVAPQTPADRIVSLGWRPPPSDDSPEPEPEPEAEPVAAPKSFRPHIEPLRLRPPVVEAPKPRPILKEPRWTSKFPPGMNRVFAQRTKDSYMPPRNPSPYRATHRRSSILPPELKVRSNAGPPVASGSGSQLPAEAPAPRKKHIPRDSFDFEEYSGQCAELEARHAHLGLGNIDLPGQFKCFTGEVSPQVPAPVFPKYFDGASMDMPSYSESAGAANGRAEEKKPEQPPRRKVRIRSVAGFDLPDGPITESTEYTFVNEDDLRDLYLGRHRDQQK
ncbi:hypothetical protein K474DRAFT_1660986 [Panus rudis PR-1116 ss-1]|nr:hypothetical protein K474DRAFT_1660986 [Panus rudis PR-1116 ss-1]